jgi:hypothetical protein
MENVVRIHSLARTCLWRPSPASFAGEAPQFLDSRGRPMVRIVLCGADADL